MKKILALILGALFLKTPVAVAETSTFALDDSASFTVARAVKLGDSDGDYGTAPTVSAKKETNLKRKECKSDSDCTSSQKCVGGKCESVCTGSTCSGETPDCSAEKHKAVCKCTETSCGSGKKCSDGKCVPCSVGDKCNCSGAQVIVSGGKCGCSASSTCPAGQYKTDDCSCRNCVKDDTYNRCGCVAPLVPDGKGGCYCKEKTCNAGNSFSTSSCGCVPCTDNASCQYPCPNGQTPNGIGGCGTEDPCKTMTCSGGQICTNGECGCPAGTAWYNNQCRKVGCPSAYSDHYDMMKKGSNCTLSPNGEVMQIGSADYTLCAKCTPYSCPTATTRADQLQNCKTSKSSGFYSGSMECVECTRCNSGYYLFMGKCLKCVNATCDGTDTAICNDGYTDGGIKNDTYSCTKASCVCTSASTGTYSGTVGSDHKVSFASICTKSPVAENGCSYGKTGTYIQLTSDHSSVTGTGDTRIRCATTSTTSIKCSHEYEPKSIFTVTIPAITYGSCSSGYCKNNEGICVPNECNVPHCRRCLCGDPETCLKCADNWRLAVGRCDCKDSRYENGRWMHGACF